MFSVFDTYGRMLVANAPEVPATTFSRHFEIGWSHPVEEKFYKLIPTTVHGVITQQWVETSPPHKQYDAVSGKWYALALVNVHGIQTQKWIEVTA